MAEIIHFNADGGKESRYALLTEEKRKEFIMSVIMDLVSEDPSLTIKDAGKEGGIKRAKEWAQEKIRTLVENTRLREYLSDQSQLWQAESELALRVKVKNAIRTYLQKMNIEAKKGNEKNTAS